MMKHKLLVILLFLYSFSYGQEVAIPVAPNIASMGEYGSFPIGYHTGTPAIGFPLYEIDLDGLTIPIKLNYNSSGIRIDQSAGWVGLGWSLESGGYIAKEVRGYDDFSFDDASAGIGGVSPGYYFTQSSNYSMFVSKLNYNPETGIIGGDLQSFEAEYMVGQDNEPDLYHFNFCGYSGTFYFNPLKDGDPVSDFIKPVIKSSNQYLDITYNKKNETWVIIDQRGYKFSFIRKEYAYVYGEQTEYVNGKQPELGTSEFSTDKRKLAPLKKGGRTSTSCLLESIESPKGRKVYFTYKREDSSTPILTSHITDIPVFDKTYSGFTFGGGEYNYDNYTYSEIKQLLPETIRFDGGTVSFVTSERKDLDRYADPYYKMGVFPQKLDKIVIADASGSVVKNIKLSYSYMGDSTDYKSCRLMLNAFETSGSQTKKGPCFRFAYKAGALPAKNSYHSDLWGYYNGTVNKVQCPTYTDLKQLVETKNIFKYPESFMFEGADRFTNAAYMQYGTLESIEYPTGGKTRFIYEPHDFHNGSNCGFVKKLLPFAFVTYVPDANIQRTEVTVNGKDFVLEEDAYVKLTCQYNIFNPTKPMAPGFALACLQQKSGSSYKTFYEGAITIDKSNGTIELRKDAIYLKKGTYRICIWRGELKGNESFNYNVSARATAFVHLNESKGGGLRIKEIQNLDDGEIVGRKRYSYAENGRSSGCLLSIPDYNFLQIMDPTVTNSVYFAGIQAAMLKYHAFYKETSPNFGTPFIPNNGAAAQVVYEYVEESSVDRNNRTTGKTTYRYMAESSNPRIPFPIPKDFHVGNGSLLEEAHYDSEGILQKKKVFTYSFKPIPGSSPLYLSKFWEPAKYRTGLQFYKVKPAFWSLDTVSDTDYFERGQRSVARQTSFKYNMGNRLVSETTDRAGATAKVTCTKYATDFTDAMARKMEDKKMTGIPLETIVLKDGKIIAGNKSEYYADQADAILKRKSYSLKISPSLSIGNYAQSYEEDYTISRYDTFYNPVEIVRKDGSRDTYLWSYNGQYLIAEIKNCDYSTVNSAVSSIGLTSIDALSALSVPDPSKLDLLRKQYSLKDAYVTTFRYKPLIGVTQITDPAGLTTYYEYDRLGRLIRLSDVDRYPIQEYDYHYRNQ